MLNPLISLDIHLRAQQIIINTLNKAREIFSEFAHLITDIELSWQKLKSATAGLAYLDERKIVLNTLYVGEKYFWENTIVHEVAHILQHILYPEAKIAHGREWKYIMSLFNADPSAYHPMHIPLEITHVFECPICAKEYSMTHAAAKKVDGGDHRFCNKMECIQTIGKSIDKIFTFSLRRKAL